MQELQRKARNKTSVFRATTDPGQILWRSGSTFGRMATEKLMGRGRLGMSFLQDCRLLLCLCYAARYFTVATGSWKAGTVMRFRLLASERKRNGVRVRVP